jgi:hypothetical protein
MKKTSPRTNRPEATKLAGAIKLTVAQKDELEGILQRMARELGMSNEQFVTAVKQAGREEMLRRRTCGA